MASLIDRHFGSLRGAVRLGLSYCELASGLAPVIEPEREEVRRLVFVCHGNICRSAYAEGFARWAGYNAASFGLSTCVGKPAFAKVSSLAARRGIDLSAHRSTPADEFEPWPGDYLLAMEVRHLRQLAQHARLRHIPRGLLGSHAEFPLPYLHDPYMLDEDYVVLCLRRIESAVVRLFAKFPNARAGR
jgi:protein-tyrosine phosphatase